MDYSSYYSIPSSSTDVLSTSQVAGIAGIMAIFLIINILIVLATITVIIIANWKIFKKAGEEGWKSIVPVYNIITEFKIVGLNPLLVLIYLAAFIPFIGGIAALVMNIILLVYLAKSFGKSGGFAVGLIFLGPIFLCILAFGKSEYVGTPYSEINS